MYGMMMTMVFTVMAAHPGYAPFNILPYWLASYLLIGITVYTLAKLNLIFAAQLFYAEKHRNVSWAWKARNAGR